MDICALPGCSNPVKNWRTHFCCNSHGGKYSALHLPKLPNKSTGVRIKRVPNGSEHSSSLPYKDRTPETKGKWIAYMITRVAKIKQATPKWSDTESIEQFYKHAQQQTIDTGIPHEVDHIIPISGKLVCGLHVPNNLQILTEKENQRKSAKFTV